MASKKSSHPFGQIRTSGGAQTAAGHDGTTLEEFARFSWRSTVTPAEVEELKVAYRVPLKGVHGASPYRRDDGFQRLWH